MAATTSANSSTFSLSGLASGLNWTNIVSELLQIQAAPETQMKQEETTDNSKNSAYQTIGSDLTQLAADSLSLKNPSFFESRTATVGNTSVASATAAQGTPVGTYAIDIKQLATDSVQVGTSASAPLSPTDDVSGLTLSSAGFATPITAGNITVNGQSIAITTSETLQDVFNAINTATSGAVTGSYDSSTDEITLSSSSAITLGSDTDTSNFLTASELYNNGTGTITSTSALGGINLAATLNQANTTTAINDGGSGAGEFKINGVQINYDASTDSISDVLQRINDSNAGVTATYDSLNNRFELSDTTAGDVGISLQDVTGNFLAATGLSGGTLQAGTNCQYTVNNGGLLTSQSNTLDLSSSGLSGLSVTALGVNSTTITVASDTSTISSAISQFVSDYNAVQNYISSQTATTTSSTGTVTPGLLTGDMDAEGIMTDLRNVTGNSPGGQPAGFENLDAIGVNSNGNDNTLSVNSTQLTTALTTNLSAVQNLFTNSDTGIATALSNYLGSETSTTGLLSLNGLLNTDENNFTNEANTLATSISTLQSQVSADQTSLDAEFTNMETAINSLNSEKAYLNAYFSSSSSSSSQSAPTAAGSGSSSSSSSSS